MIMILPLTHFYRLYLYYSISNLVKYIYICIYFSMNYALLSIAIRIPTLFINQFGVQNQRSARISLIKVSKHILR